MITPTTFPDFKALYKKLENALSAIEAIDGASAMLSGILAVLVSQFRDELGFENGRCYERDGDQFVLCDAFPDPKAAPLGFKVPREYAPHLRTLADGLLILRPDDPLFDPLIESAIGVRSTFVAIAVGEGNAYILAFSVRGEIHEEEILYSLSAVRHVINLKLAQQRLTGMLEESRKIQESLLPAAPPAFEGYELYGMSRPTEVVGGDLFDYLVLSDRLLGVALGDASGHGLPAALLARDVVTGLRVGMDEDLKVARVIERLNRVIHKAALSSRFISLFYGEFARNGSLIYCNAGHDRPLLLQGGRFTELDRGGIVLGPNPNARYETGHIHLEPGATIIAYTDGIIEQPDPHGNQFGLPRLRDLLLTLEGSDARTIVEATFAAVDAHTAHAAQPDDMSVVVVRRV